MSTADTNRTPIITWPAPIAIAACASTGAGAIHAAAIGSHNEHRALVLLFVWSAAAQMGWGIAALLRTSRLSTAIGLATNLVLLAAWFITRMTAVSFIDGLDHRESVRFPDSAAAGLALVAFAIALGVLLTPGTSGRTRIEGVGIPAFAVAALTLPAMLVGGTASHDDPGGHGHSSGSAPSAVVPPKPYDPAQPIDLSGVEGVSPEQQARAENLVANTLARLPQFADVDTAISRGWKSVGDAITGFEHFINWSLIDDNVALDPEQPESLVYRVQPDGSRTLVSAMYMLPTSVGLDEVPDIGGRLTQWHLHNDLCLTNDPAAPRVGGFARPDGTCRAPLEKFPPAAMIHVWVVPHECGPFAALEGVGAGQIRPGEERWCDHVHGTPGALA